MPGMRGGSTRSILLFLTLGSVAGCAAQEGRAPSEAAQVAAARPAEPAPEPEPSVLPPKRRGAKVAPPEGLAEGAALSPEAAARRVARRRAQAAERPRSTARSEATQSLDEAAPAAPPTAGPELEDTPAAEEARPAPPAPDEDAPAKLDRSTRSARGGPPAGADDAGFAAPGITAAPGAGPRQLGRLFLHGPGVGGALGPKLVRVISRVQGARVHTELDFVFENRADRPLEGTFHVELPPDATPAGLSTFSGAPPREALGDQTPEQALLRDARADAPARARVAGVDWKTRVDAKIVAAPEGRRAAVADARRRSPGALLEWGGGQAFTARVHPILPGRLKRVIVRYEAPLPYAKGRATLALPAAPAGAEASATVYVDRAHAEVAALPSDASSTADGAWARVDVPKLGAPSRIELTVTAPQAVLRGRAPGMPGDAFYARLAPEIAPGEARSTGRAVFLVDTSASETPAQAARRAGLLQAILTSDPTLEAYAVLLFDVRARWLHGLGYRENSPANRAQTLAALKKVYLEGATNLDAALGELERQRGWAVDGAPTTAFLLSDGHVTWGEDDPGRLVATNPVVRDVRLNAYRFDAEPSRGALLSALARAGGGRVVTVNEAAGVEAAAQAHLRGGAWLESVRVVGAPSADVVIDGEPTMLFPGQVLTVAGRLPQGGEARLVVTTRAGAKTSVSAVPIGAPGQADAFAPGGWGDVYARHLEALGDPRLDRVLVAMARRFSLANRKASFSISDVAVTTPDPIDPADLLRQVRAARAASRRAAEGLSTQDLSPKVQALLTELRRSSDGPMQGAPLVFAPAAGGAARAAEEVRYRAARPQRPGDLRVYERVARARALAGDTVGAIRALSTPVERWATDASALRTVGYALLALEQHPAAVELFAKLRRQRPFEPQAWLEEALALEAAGRLGLAALRYERLLVDAPEAKAAARAQYAALLARAGGEAARARRAELSAGPEPDLRVAAHWSTDPGDVDLWVYEPSGARVWRGRPASPGGGRLVAAAEALGPELYEAAPAAPGPYDLLVHYRAGAPQRPERGVGVLLFVDRGTTRRFFFRVLSDPNAVLLVRTEQI